MIHVLSKNPESKTTSNSSKREVIIENDKRLARRLFDERTFSLYDKTPEGLLPKGVVETGLAAVRFVRGRT